MFTVVSFGTAYPAMYRRKAIDIHKKCKELNINNYVWIPEAVYLYGYYKAVLYKPTFIKDMLKGFNHTILWIDADCEILDKFNLPDGEWDIGLVPHPIERNRKNFTPYCGAFIAFKPTDRAKNLLDSWENMCKWNLPIGDHERLIWTLAILKDRITIVNLLPELRNKVYMDPRHRKRTTFKEVPTNVDNWSIDFKLSWIEK